MLEEAAKEITEEREIGKKQVQAGLRERGAFCSLLHPVSGQSPGSSSRKCRCHRL